MGHFFIVIKQAIIRTWQFLTYDIWRITENEFNSFGAFLIVSLKALLMSINRFINDRLSSKASALTYSTLLAIVPTLALLFSIAKGFNSRTIIESQLLSSFPGQQEILLKALTFVDNYLSQAQGGLFVGLGIVLLLWTVLSLIGNIESAFNEIWYVKKGRSIYRQITDYFSLILLIPLFMVFSSGLTLFITTFASNSNYAHLLSPLASAIFAVLPFFVTCTAFTFIYVYIPNTHVKLKYAIIPGLISGIAFQIFQYFYISGQIWVSKYNAIYGSFAALPLLLLWLQISWIICLYGAALTNAAQNARNYSFEKETKTISRRYKDFVTLVVVSMIVRQFIKQDRPYSSDDISFEGEIPTSLTKQILYELGEIGIIIEVYNEQTRMHVYQPAFDVHLMTVGDLFDRIGREGSENFNIDKNKRFSAAWHTMKEARAYMSEKMQNVRIMDLPIPPKPEQRKTTVKHSLFKWVQINK